MNRQTVSLVADLLLQQFPQGAPRYAAERIADARELGDLEGSRMWREVLDLIERKMRERADQ